MQLINTVNTFQNL